MSTIIQDFFYESDYSTYYTSIVNDFMRDNIEGFQHISYLYDMENLYYKIINLIIEYSELMKKNEFNYGERDYLEIRKARLIQDIDELRKSSLKDSYSGEKIIDYKLTEFRIGLKNEELDSIERNLDKNENDTRVNNRRISFIKDVLLGYYNDLLETYDEDALDDMYIKVDADDCSYLARRFNRRFNNCEEADYLSIESYKALLDEIDYLIDVFKEISKLSFKDLTDEKLEELKKSRIRMSEAKEMIELKRDLLEHIFFIDIAQRDKNKLFRNNKKTVSSKVMIDYASMYLDTYKKNKLSDLTTKYAGHIIDAVDSTSPTPEEKRYAKRLYHPYLSNIKY